MRLVIDLQGAQGISAARGIGRYSRELALAMASAPREHEVIVVLSGLLAEPAAEIAASFAKISPGTRISLWHPPRAIEALRNTALRAFAQRLRVQFLAALKPDLVHVSSIYEGLGDDIVTVQPAHLERLPVVATCYDLIPLIRHEQYFGKGGVLEQSAHWYYRCVHEMAMSEGLLAISESSRLEAIAHLSFDPQKVFNIQSGISSNFRPLALAPAERDLFLRRYGLRGPFILFLGAGDVRKNEAGLIAAYARLPPAMRDRYQLLIVGKLDQVVLYKTARRLNLRADDFVIVPFVPESDLNALYSACALFVFPSLHEGFGLPVAEAMACGAPVIASNTTSLPEVIGRDDAGFDPTDPDAIARCMQKVLGNEAFRHELAQWGPVQAARFSWPASATRAWDALEAIHARRQERAARPLVPILAARPSLAFVAPFPPQASGIADYSYDLVFVLARHYDITLVTESEIADVRLQAAFPCLRPDAFLGQAGRFDRVLYQIGNSEYHRFQIEDLLPQCPGMVVLHDAFLSDYASWSSHVRRDPASFREALLVSHGYPALRYHADYGREAAITHYPCTLPVLQAAIGVIQHSEHGAAILKRFFGSEAGAAPWIIPHLAALRPKQDKRAARALLGLDPDRFVVCSFGGVYPLKRPELIADAWRATGINGCLSFVGAGPARLVESLHDAKAGIRCTGRVSIEQYNLWLHAADLAVQWRTESRGESSGAVIDVLSAGLPLIVNLHGSAAEIPRDAVFGLPDETGPEALAQAILLLQADAARRNALAVSAHDYVRETMAPDIIAKRYFEAVEQAYARPTALCAAPHFAPEIGASAALPGALGAMSKSLSRSFASPWRTGGFARLLVDISELARRDAHSGIQRVVREIGRRVLGSAPAPYRGAAIRAADGGIFETFARPLEMLGLAKLPLAERPLDPGPGDIVICADVNAELTDAEFAEFRRLQLAGTRIILIVYDLLPILHPELFPEAIGRLVSAWYARMLSIADGAACISHAVAKEVAAWLDADPARRRTALPIGFFHLGADLAAGARPGPGSAPEIRALSNAAARPTVLMTGTIEPRKGYAQTLDAFESLWREGVEIGLTIVGKPGWGTAELIARLNSSPELGKRLHWLPDCGDALLRQLYGACAGLLMASTCEGFGLPIVEAANLGLPLLMRDLPVFREIANDHARYFEGDSPEALATALRDWRADGFTPVSAGIRPLSWDESFRRLQDLILNQAWQIMWRPGGSSAAA